jgi:hypothetical protein
MAFFFSRTVFSTLRPRVAMWLALVGQVCVKSVHVMSQQRFFRVIRSRKLIGDI